MSDNEITNEKTRIEQETLKELEKELQRDPLNSHGRKKGEKSISLPFEFDHHSQARAVKEYTLGRIRFIAGINEFAVYDNSRGVYITGEFALSALWCVIERLAWARMERCELLEKSEQETALSFGKKMLNRREGKSIIELAKEKELTSMPPEFDNNPLLINCLGEAWDFKTGKSRAASRDDRFLKTAGFRPEKMKTPEFDKFMKQVTMDRADLAAWIMRFFGYSITGITTHEIFANFHGTGRNGKGTLIHVMQRIMKDYQVELPLSAIVLEPHENKKAFDLADLPGKRMAVVSDVPKNTRYNIEVVKKLTGNDVLRAEQKYQKSYQFKNTAKLIVCSNNEIRLPSTGPDMRDRLRFIPFDLYVPPEKQDHNLTENLLKEAPGILYRLIQEAVAYVKSGEFPRCKVIDDATAAYIDKQDTVKMFCADCIVDDFTSTVQAGALYAKYKSWCENSDYKPMQNRGFGEEIAKKYDRGRSENGNYYRNIRIKEG